MSEELITLERTDALAIFREPEKRELVISKFRKIAEDFAPNLDTDKGRKENASMAFKVTKAKTYVVSFGKDAITELREKERALVAEIQAERTEINDGVKTFSEEMDAIAADIRRPLTEWQAKKAEQEKRDERRL
jgi:colicin import membrane protein